jgi:predicted RNase H-like nuclease
MFTASSNLVVSAPADRTPQLHVRKLRLEVREAEGFVIPDRAALAVRARRRAWWVAGSIATAGAALWTAWALLAG